MKRAPLMATPLLVFALAGCQTLDDIAKVGTAVGVASGKISQDQADSINRTSAAAGKAFEQLTPEQEYYVGRAVAATLLGQYKLADSPAATHYLNVLGQALAMASDRPETFGGYRFAIMDTPEINAFAAPGGIILVSRGLLGCCRTEDEVAAVLAHEVGHVQLAHGLQAISKSRLTSAVTILAAEGAKQLGGKELAELTTALEGSVGDVVNTMANNGYSRAFESQADKAAVTIMTRVGYDPTALKSMLSQMQQRTQAGGPGFAKTHPAPADRIRELEPLLKAAAVPPPAARQQRYQAALASF